MGGDISDLKGGPLAEGMGAWKLFWEVGVSATHEQMSGRWGTLLGHTCLREGEIALVCERCVHKLGRVALVLVCVLKVAASHFDAHGAALTAVVAQLLAPCPIVQILAGRWDRGAGR